MAKIARGRHGSTRKGGAMLITPLIEGRAPYLYHPCFDDPASAADLDPCDRPDFPGKYSPKRDAWAKAMLRKMHYAADRVDNAVNEAERSWWKDKYDVLRNTIIENNLEMVYIYQRENHRHYRNKGEDLDLLFELYIDAVSVTDPWAPAKYTTMVTNLLWQKEWTARKQRQQELQRFDEGDLTAARDYFRSRHSPDNEKIALLLSDECDVLTEREKMVIERIFGLNNADELPAQVVARQLNYHEGVIGEIKRDAIRKLRDVLEDDWKIGSYHRLNGRRSKPG